MQATEEAAGAASPPDRSADKPDETSTRSLTFDLTETEEAILDVYLHALEGTPLGDWSSRQDAANEVMAV